MELATVDTAQLDQPQATLDTSGTPQIPSEKIAQTRAYKAHMGVGDIIKKGYQEIYDSIASGNEQAIREEAATTLDANYAAARSNAIINFAAQNGRQPSLEEIQALSKPQTDPNTVIENEYAKQYVSTLDSAARNIQDTILDDAKAQNPEAVQRYFNTGSEILSKREYALKKAEGYQQSAEQQSWFGFTDPIWGEKHNISSYDVKELATLGFYSSLKLRGNTEETSRFGFLGNVLDAEAKELLNNPSPDFERKLDGILDILGRAQPELAVRFAQAVAGMSTSEKFVNNAMEAANVVGAGQLVGGLRTIVRGIGQRSVERMGERAAAAENRGGLVQGPDGVYRATSTTPTTSTEVTVTGKGAQAQAQKAVEDIVKSANVPEVSKATIAEGAGDVQEAAVQRTVNSVLEPNPEQDAIDTLMDHQRANLNEITTNPPPNLAREGHTRLIDASSSYLEKEADLLKEVTKVIRTPLAAENGFRDMADRVKDYFPGRENTIANINSRYDRISNTFHWDVDIVNYDGNPFSSLEQTLAHARANGYGPVIVGEEPNKLYIPTAAAKALESVKTTPEGTRFYVDQGIEVESSAKPFPGAVPYNLTTNKFETPLTDQTVHVEQQGLGFRLRFTFPVDETDPFLRDRLIGEPKSRSSSNKETGTLTKVANAVLGYVRNPDDTLSKIDVENRGKVVYTQGKFLQLAQQQVKEVEKIYRGMTHVDEYGRPLNVMLHRPVSIMEGITGKKTAVWDQFRRTLVASQKLPDKQGLPGYYMNPAELHHFYMANWGRPPTFQEYKGYEAIKNLDYLDFALRRIAVYRNKARVGVESHTLSVIKDGQKNAVSTFDGRRLKGFEHVTTTDPILVQDIDGHQAMFNSLSPQRQKEIRQQVQEGRYRGVELYDAEQMPLNIKDTKGNQLLVRYVFSNALDSKPITYDQVGYRGGGHWNYDYGHAVKQPIIHRQWVGGREQNVYLGDRTFTFASNRAEGEGFAKHFDRVRALLDARRPAEAKAYANQFLDLPWKTIIKSFYPAKNRVTGVMQPPRFNMKEQFRVVPQGMTIRDLDDQLELRYNYRNPKTGAERKTFVDGTKKGLARNFQVEYTQARDSYDLFEAKNAGSLSIPFYKFQPAELTDPIVAMSRGLQRIVNNTYMDDYKIFTAEHFLQENKDLMKATESELRSAPFFHFNEASNPFSYNRAADKLRVATAISNAWKAKQLMGTPSVVDTTVQAIKQVMSDSLYELGRDTAVTKLDRRGTKLAKIVKAPLIAPEWLLDRVTNPVDFARGMAYHTYLGLFNWVQAVVQNVSWTTIASLSPTHVMQGAYGSLVYQWLRVNPRHVDYFDRIGTNFGWKLGEISEGIRVLDRTGFAITGRTMSIQPTASMKEPFFRGWFGKFLDAGQIVFHEADKNVRLGAWFTAWHEFRDANPLLKVGPVQEGQILRRARDLNTNMDRSSNSLLNKGAVGMTFQFFDFQKKLAELFISKRIGDTITERSFSRLRMYALYALLFSPLGALGLSGFPLTDLIRKKALEQGYVPGENLGSTLMLEGPLSVLGALITGKGDTQAGTYYNFNNRLGANGIQIVRDLLQTDPNFWKIVMGASGTSLGNALGNLSGFANAMYSMIEGNPAKEAWPLKEADWIKGAETAASFKYAERLAYALAYHKWRDSHGRPVEKITAADAVFRTLTGVNDVNADDIFLKSLTKKDEQEMIKKATFEYQEQRRLAEQAAANGDKEQADDYNKRAFFALTSRGVPKEAWAKILAQDATINKETIEKNNEGYYRNMVPTYRQDAAREADRAIQQMKTKRDNNR